MNLDISHLLDAWEYHPGRLAVRKFRAKDGTEKIQLRLDLGLLQMNVEGRPDGKRPFGHESLLEHHKNRLTKYLQTHHTDDGFVLDAEDCSKLQQEAIQYHHRYICLFQLEDFVGVIRDTERNREALEFINQYAVAEEMGATIRQFLPQLMMMETRARGSLDLENKDYQQAIATIEHGLESIRQYYRENARQEVMDQSGELQSLESWLEEIKTKRPLTEREKLESALEEAVAKEDFEKAAQVRDALRNLKLP